MSKREVPQVIGLAGGPGAGKDTVSGLLVHHHDFRTVAFADALRDFLYATDDGWSMALDVFGYETAKATVDGFRQRMVEVGEAARTIINRDIWVEAAADRIEGYLDEGYSVVVSDVRYLNEANYLRDEFDARIFGVERPGHRPETEHALDVFLSADDYVINDGSMVQLWAAVDEVINY